jgi:hypothetical protein
MTLVAVCESPAGPAPEHGPFPRDVEFVISAMEAGPRPAAERQRLPRAKYRMRAMLTLYSDAPDQPPALLYTRHVNRQAVGFLTNRPLSLSHGGTLSIRSPLGKMMQIPCTVLRCRQAAPGWYEGAVYFNRQQPDFDPEEFLPRLALTAESLPA